jgi:hypothetical protein
MRIDPRQLQAVLPKPETDKIGGAHGSPAEDFAAILGAQEAPKERSSTPDSPLRLEETSAALLSASLLGKLQTGRASAVASPLADPAFGVDEEVDSVLKVLESYIQALGDPGKTLKDIAPLADELDRGATRLDQLAASLDLDDPLKSLTNDTAVLAAVEALKFRRGDLV